MTMGDLRMGGALVFTGLLAGAGLYASGCEVRTLLAASRNKDEELITRLMPLMWPYSRDLSTPLAVCAAAANALAWDWVSACTRTYVCACVW